MTTNVRPGYVHILWDRSDRWHPWIVSFHATNAGAKKAQAAHIAERLADGLDTPDTGIGRGRVQA